jgi:hypothetical protein
MTTLRERKRTCRMSRSLYSSSLPSLNCLVPLMMTIRAGRLTPTARVEVAPVKQTHQVSTALHRWPSEEKRLTDDGDRTSKEQLLDKPAIRRLQPGMMERYTDFKQDGELLINRLERGTARFRPWEIVATCVRVESLSVLLRECFGGLGAALASVAEHDDAAREEEKDEWG